MAIRVEVEEAAMGLWCATINAPGRHVHCFDYDPAIALETAVRVWRIANALRRESRKKLN
jgi:hypothetical protein